MPNHLHAIVVLDDNVPATDLVETHGRASLHQPTTAESFLCGIAYRKPKSISSFVAGYKSAVLSKYNNWVDEQMANGVTGIEKFNRQNPLWQSNYYDRIIRNGKEYERIEIYIGENSINWPTDELY